MTRRKEREVQKREKEDRIRQIKEQMASGLWVSTVSTAQRAAEWGMSLETIRKDSAEASRAIVRDVEDDPGVIRALVITMFARAIADLEEIHVRIKGDITLVPYQIMAIRTKLDALNGFCKAIATMPKAQEQNVLHVAVEQLATIMEAHGYSVVKKQIDVSPDSVSEIEAETDATDDENEAEASEEGASNGADE